MNTKVLALCLAALSCAAVVQAQQAQRYPQILRYSSDVQPDGGFQYSFQTEDRISAEARGTPVRSGSRDSDGDAVAISGQYSYTGPDGQEYTVSYVADENGYRASGAHLPQPPPIPEAIQRSLELNARSSSRDDDDGSFQPRAAPRPSFQPAFQQRAAPARAASFPAFQQAAAPVASFQAPQAFQQAAAPAASFPAFQQAAAPAFQAPQAFQQGFQQAAAPTASFPAFQQAAAPAASFPAFQQGFQQTAAPAASFPAFQQAAAPAFQAPQAFQQGFQQAAAPAFQAPQAFQQGFQQAAAPAASFQAPQASQQASDPASAALQQSFTNF